jgi:hypothetical protein
VQKSVLEQALCESQGQQRKNKGEGEMNINLLLHKATQEMRLWQRYTSSLLLFFDWTVSATVSVCSKHFFVIT